jgi:hypothetical protein
MRIFNAQGTSARHRQSKTKLPFRHAVDAVRRAEEGGAEDSFVNDQAETERGHGEVMAFEPERGITDQARDDQGRQHGHEECSPR